MSDFLGIGLPPNPVYCFGTLRGIGREDQKWIGNSQRHTYCKPLEVRESKQQCSTQKQGNRHAIESQRNANGIQQTSDIFVKHLGPITPPQILTSTMNCV